MANEHIFQNDLIITGSITASAGFSGDGSGLTNITSTSEWDGTRNGNASITGSLDVSGSGANVDFTKVQRGVSGSFSGSFIGDGQRLNNLNLNNTSGSNVSLTGSFSGSFIGDGTLITGLSGFPFTGSAVITGSLTVSGSNTIIDFTNISAISGSTFSGSFVGNGSGLTNLPAAEWDGSRNGNASITGSFVVSGSNPTISLLGETVIDQNILISNRDSVKSIGIGSGSLPNSTIERETLAIGYLAAANTISGSRNIAIGICALHNNVKGTQNIAIGNCALRINEGFDIGQATNLSCLIAIGDKAGCRSTSGRSSILIGNSAGQNGASVTQTVLVGHQAGYEFSGLNGTMIGHQAGFRSVSSANTFIGYRTGYYLSSGGSNAVLGSNAMEGNSQQCITGGCNTAIGSKAGMDIQGNSKCNVYLGYRVGPSTGTTQSCQLYIGIGNGETPLLRGDLGKGQLTVNNQVSASIFSGSFVGDGSGLSNVAGSGFPFSGTARISGSLIVSQSSTAGTAVTIENGHTILSEVSESLQFDNDTQAAAGGVPKGGLYRSGNFIAIRIT